MMYRKTVLKNGVRILSEKLEHYRSVSLGIWVNVGSREETLQENGISHFIEHMIFKGTRSRNNLDIAKQLDAIGGLSNAFTGKENTCFHSRVLDKHFSTLSDILSDIFLNSIFDTGEMERERQVILQEINMVEDTPDEHVHVLFNHLFWLDHPLGMSILGTGESVSGINQETILNYIKRYYTPDRIILSAAGNVDHDALLGYFQPLFEPLETTVENYPRTMPDVHGGVLCRYKETEQVHICLGGKAPHLSSDRRFAAAILNTILGGSMSSRLFQEIREKRGLAYSVYSFLSAYIDTGLLGVYVGTDPKQLNRVLRVINKEIKKIQEGDLSETDLAEAREQITGGILLGAESTDTRMMRLAKNEYVFGRYVDFDEMVAQLEKVTLDEVLAVANETFQEKEVSSVVLGPAKEEDIDMVNLNF